MARQRMHSPAYFRCVVSERFSYYRAAGRRRLADLAGAVRGGLGSSPYSIPPRFFYDDAGSALFEEICSLPEYYPTRTEAGILGSVRRELAGLLGGGFRLVELGSGHSTKTRRVLDALEDAGPGTEYVPIDISDVVEAGAVVGGEEAAPVRHLRRLRCRACRRLGHRGRKPVRPRR